MIYLLKGLRPLYSFPKIIGTIGPASSSEKTLEALIRNGLDGVRLNFSFGTHKEFEE